jgi:hypothetical protein
MMANYQIMPPLSDAEFADSETKPIGLRRCWCTIPGSPCSKPSNRCATS